MDREYGNKKKVHMKENIRETENPPLGLSVLEPNEELDMLFMVLWSEIFLCFVLTLFSWLWMKLKMFFLMNAAIKLLRTSISLLISLSLLIMEGNLFFLDLDVLMTFFSSIIIFLVLILLEKVEPHYLALIVPESYRWSR